MVTECTLALATLLLGVSPMGTPAMIPTQMPPSVRPHASPRVAPALVKPGFVKSGKDTVWYPTSFHYLDFRKPPNAEKRTVLGFITKYAIADRRFTDTPSVYIVIHGGNELITAALPLLLNGRPYTSADDSDPLIRVLVETFQVGKTLPPTFMGKDHPVAISTDHYIMPDGESILSTDSIRTQAPRE